MNNLVANLMVENIPETVDYYREQLGFKLIHTHHDDEPHKWVTMSHGHNCQLMFQERDLMEKQVKSMDGANIGASITLYINVEHVDALYEKCKVTNKIEQELHNTDYGTREFTMQDCNGYILTFSQRLY